MARNHQHRSDDILSAAFFCITIKTPPIDVKCEKAWWISTLRGYILNELNQRFRLQSQAHGLHELGTPVEHQEVQELLGLFDPLELQVVKLKAAGYKGKEIAEKFGCNPSKVTRTLKSAREKAIKYYGRIPV